MTTNTRHVPLAGTPNFRDLGGYKSRRGGSVVHGRLYRSGTLSYLDEDDWQTLSGLNISVIADFRREDERLREPTQLPGDSNIELLEIPVGAGSHNGVLQEILQHEHGSEANVFELMVEINRAFVLEYREPFTRLLQRVLALPGDEALLFHCSAGKDRTGFAAAMLLACLDVDREQILNDYLLTRRYFDPEKELANMQQRFADIDWSALYSERLLPLLDTQAEYLGAAFKAIDEHWGNTETFLHEAMGVDPDMRAQLQARFLA